MSIEDVHQQVLDSSAILDEVFREIGTVIVGQGHILRRLIIGVLVNGHVLIEGVPGLAKTLIVSTLASVFDAENKRIQFTPDLLPADITGTLIYDQRSGISSPRKGLSSATLSWQMRSTAHPQRCRAPCWKQCRSAR